MYEITDFFELHFLLQFMYAFTFTFVFFVFIMEYKVFALRLKKKGFLYINSDSLPLKLLGYVYLAFAYISFYSLGWLFYLVDVVMNVWYMPMLFGQLPNKFSEGWTVTARVRYHKKQPGMYYQKYISLVICDRFLEPVDDGHCS